MRKDFWFIALAFPPLVLIPFSNVLSQEVSSVSVDKPAVTVGETVTIRVRVTSPTDTFGCGLQLTTGDGRAHDARIFEAKDASFEVQHAYAAPGNYVVSVVGKGFIRGLKSTFPCSGNQSLAVVVSPSSGSASPSCVEPSDEYRTIACPGGMVGQILQKRSYRCPGPTPSGWSTQTTDCKAASSGAQQASPAVRAPAATSPPAATDPRSSKPKTIVGE